jgi:hypothetical protein
MMWPLLLLVFLLVLNARMVLDTFRDQHFFVTRHGVKEGLFNPETDEPHRYRASKPNESFVIPCEADGTSCTESDSKEVDQKDVDEVPADHQFQVHVVNRVSFLQTFTGMIDVWERKLLRRLTNVEGRTSWIHSGINVFLLQDTA